jgi:hypothetical protein
LSNLTASYHSLQVSASKQLSHSFSVSGFYVWSKALDSFEPDADGLSTPAGLRLLWHTLHRHQQLVWALSAAASRRRVWPYECRHSQQRRDLRHVEYRLLPRKQPVVKEVVNGWQISPIVYLHSGGVFEVTTGSNKSLTAQHQPSGLCPRRPQPRTQSSPLPRLRHQ